MGYVVITGVSSGIGRALATDLVTRGYTVFGSVRRLQDAGALQSELRDSFVPLQFDVTEPASIADAAKQVEARIGDAGLCCLVNNAGVVVAGPLMHLKREDIRHQLEVNVVGLLGVTQAFLPLLGARRGAPHPPGRIINLGSVSGHVCYPFMGAYAASKHALKAISDTLRRELMIYGIAVVLVEAGTTNTPIIGKLQQQLARFDRTDYGASLGRMIQKAQDRENTGLPVQTVVDVVRTALQAEHPRTRYLVPRRWLTGWLLPRWLPDRWLDWLVARELGLKA